MHVLGLIRRSLLLPPTMGLAGRIAAGCRPRLASASARRLPAVVLGPSHSQIRSLHASRPLQLDDRTYHRHADEYLDSVAHHLEELGDEIELEGFDVLFANGVITLKLGSKGTFVLNKQPPNKQIWLSSPISGPMRFDLIEDNGRTQWIYHRGNVKLTELLNKELTQLLDRDVDVESNMDD